MKFPEHKKYQIIYADPPWEYDSSRCIAENSCLSKNEKKLYQSMTLKEICKLPVKNITAKNCLLFLWVTGPKLKESFKVISAWGFRYATVAFVWEKIKPTPGYYTLSSTEFCLISRRGKIPINRGKRNVRQFYSEKKSVHSKKPDGIRLLINDMFPKASKIELFSRDHHSGWDVWGNETPNNYQKQLIQIKHPIIQQISL